MGHCAYCGSNNLETSNYDKKRKIVCKTCGYTGATKERVTLTNLIVLLIYSPLVLWAPIFERQNTSGIWTTFPTHDFIPIMTFTSRYNFLGPISNMFWSSVYRDFYLYLILTLLVLVLSIIFSAMLLIAVFSTEGGIPKNVVLILSLEWIILGVCLAVSSSEITKYYGYSYGIFSFILICPLVLALAFFWIYRGMSKHRRQATVKASKASSITK